MREKLLKSIDQLKERNQYIADNYGTGKGTKIMDEVINNLIDIYNDTVTKIDYETMSKKLIAILELFAIPWQELNQFDIKAIQHLTKVNELQNTFTSMHEAYMCIYHDLRMISEMLNTKIKYVRIWHECEPLRESIATMCPELCPFFNTNLSLEKNLENLRLNFYAGNIE